MKPREPRGVDQQDLFRKALPNLIGRRHELVRLAKIMDWSSLNSALGEPLYRRPTFKPSRFSMSRSNRAPIKGWSRCNSSSRRMSFRSKSAGGRARN